MTSNEYMLYIYRIHSYFFPVRKYASISSFPFTFILPHFFKIKTDGTHEKPDPGLNLPFVFVLPLPGGHPNYKKYFLDN
jgi:hypothetical protein